VERVLIASRGEMARRLIRFFKERDIETVSVFSEVDVEGPWVEEADYDMYLNGRTVDDTYMHPRRIVSAAMDAGCDAIHPGCNFLAERPELFDIAIAANIPVIGADPKALMRVQDRMGLRAAASELGIPLIPASDVIPEAEDGIAAGAQLGFPLFVKSVAAGIFRVVNSQEELPSAMAAMRDLSQKLEGDRRVYLERAVGRMRHIGTVVVGDHHGATAFLGHTDGSIKANYHTWIEEMGTEVVGGDLPERLGDAAVYLSQKLGWTGVGRVSWALTPDGGWYLLGFSCRLTSGFSLVEQVYGIDLISTQMRVCTGNPLDWDGMASQPNKFGLQLRILHVDPADMSRPEGMIENLGAPEGDGVTMEWGTDIGFECNADTDPVLGKLTVTGPTRHAAIVRAKAALAEVIVEGVPTNKDVLMDVLGDNAFWKREQDSTTLPRLLGN